MMAAAVMAFVAVGGGSCTPENNGNENNDNSVKAEIIGEDVDVEISGSGGETYTYIFETTRDWAASVSADDPTYEVTVEPLSGVTGKNEINIAFPAADKEIVVAVTIVLKGTSTTKSFAAAPVSKTLKFKVTPLTSITYAGETYKVVKLKDGKYWMAENLRYVPEGLTPSNDLSNVTAGVYYPVKVNDAQTAAEFASDEETIKANGYLYQTETALGLAVNSIKTVEDAKALEGVQGICPEGWHIPTLEDWHNLVGKLVSPVETNVNAPYYDAAMKQASIELLNVDGFNLSACGAVSIQDNTKTSATLMGWSKNTPDKIFSGYICGSTLAENPIFKKGEDGKNEKDENGNLIIESTEPAVKYIEDGKPESGIKDVQFYGLMPMATNGTANGSKLSYKMAASVRCVKNN